MKRTNLVFAFAVVVSTFVFCSHVEAQRKVITSKEYFEGVSRTGVKYYDKSRRVETTDETIANGVVTRSVLQVHEVLLPNLSRNYTKTKEGDKVTEWEQITIDHMQYTRKDGGNWTKVDLRQAGYGSGSGSGSGSSQQCSQFSVESAFLDGRAVEMFEWLLVDGSSKELSFRELRKWIGPDGLPYREENILGKLVPREEKEKRVTTYEYEPNIKIEAPIK